MAVKRPEPPEVRRVVKRLGDAIAAYAAAAEQVGATEHAVAGIAALHARLVGGRWDGLLRQLQAVEQDLGAIVHRYAREAHAAAGLKGKARLTIDGLGTVEATSSGSRSRKWHGGQQVARRIALRVVDRSRVDPTTGEVRDEPLPPAVLAEMIADEIVACAGLANASASWRTTELTERNIDPDEFSDMEGESRPTARWV